MNKQLIRDLAITGSIYDCICDPYDQLKNGDHHSSVMIDLERFAEKIVRECMSVADLPNNASGQWDHLLSSEVIGKHFGVES